MKRCPAALVSDMRTRSLVSYFYFWRNSHQYPDGGPIIEQPTTLVSAFNFMSNLAYEYEKPKAVK